MRIFVDSFKYKLRRLFKYKFLALLALQYFPFAKIFFLKHTKCVTKSKHLFNKGIFFSLKTLFTQKNYGKKTSIYCGYSTLITFNWNYLQTAICKCRPVLITSTPVNNKMTSYLLQTQLISIQILRQTYLTRQSQDRFKIIRFAVNIKSYLYLPKPLLVFHRQCALYIKEDSHFNIYVIFSMSVIVMQRCSRNQNNSFMILWIYFLFICLAYQVISIRLNNDGYCIKKHSFMQDMKHPYNSSKSNFKGL